MTLTDRKSQMFLTFLALVPCSFPVAPLVLSVFLVTPFAQPPEIIPLYYDKTLFPQLPEIIPLCYDKTLFPQPPEITPLCKDKAFFPQPPEITPLLGQNVFPTAT